METVENTSSVTEQVSEAILKAFEASEYLNNADFRLLAEGKSQDVLDAAVSSLLESGHMVELNIYDDDLDGIETGHAETIYAAVKPIGQTAKSMALKAEGTRIFEKLKAELAVGPEPVERETKKKTAKG